MSYISEEEEVDSDKFIIIFLMNPYIRSLWVCNPIVFNLREVQEISVPAEVDGEFPPNNNEMEEISESRAVNKEWVCARIVRLKNVTWTAYVVTKKHL